MKKLPSDRGAKDVRGLLLLMPSLCYDFREAVSLNAVRQDCPPITLPENLLRIEQLAFALKVKKILTAKHPGYNVRFRCGDIQRWPARPCPGSDTLGRSIG
jgi:hypothetical protein